MAVQDVKWLAENIETDANHRLVTDEQIEKWDGACTETLNWSTTTTPGLYVSGSNCEDQPNDDGYTKFLGRVSADSTGNILTQEIVEISDSATLEAPARFVRKGTRPDADTAFTFGSWYQYALNKYLSKDEKAAIILQDFEYVKDSDTGNYILTEWKETLNGEPSNDLVIPDTDEIQIEI